MGLTEGVAGEEVSKSPADSFYFGQFRHGYKSIT
jgi:hypothetical protein